MSEGPFKHLTQQVQQQIIVIENTDDLAGADETLFGNKVTFTKSAANGIYVYLANFNVVSVLDS